MTNPEPGDGRTVSQARGPRTRDPRPAGRCPPPTRDPQPVTTPGCVVSPRCPRTPRPAGERVPSTRCGAGQRSPIQVHRQVPPGPPTPRIAGQPRADRLPAGTVV